MDNEWGLTPIYSCTVSRHAQQHAPGLGLFAARRHRGGGRGVWPTVSVAVQCAVAFHCQGLLVEAPLHTLALVAF